MLTLYFRIEIEECVRNRYILISNKPPLFIVSQARISPAGGYSGYSSNTYTKLRECYE